MNIFKTTENLVKTQSAVTQMEKTVGKATNWKTSLCGYITLIMTLAILWGPPQYQKKLIETELALVGVGLIKAKDGDVTGGSRQQ